MFRSKRFADLNLEHFFVFQINHFPSPAWQPFLGKINPFAILSLYLLQSTQKHLHAMNVRLLQWNFDTSFLCTNHCIKSIPKYFLLLLLQSTILSSWRTCNNGIEGVLLKCTGTTKHSICNLNVNLLFSTTICINQTYCHFAYKSKNIRTQKRNVFSSIHRLRHRNKCLIKCSLVAYVCAKCPLILKYVKLVSSYNRQQFCDVAENQCKKLYSQRIDNFLGNDCPSECMVFGVTNECDGILWDTTKSF